MHARPLSCLQSVTSSSRFSWCHLSFSHSSPHPPCNLATLSRPLKYAHARTETKTHCLTKKARWTVSFWRAQWVGGRLCGMYALVRVRATSVSLLSRSANLRPASSPRATCHTTTPLPHKRVAPQNTRCFCRVAPHPPPNAGVPC
jgi:hypothetical protein